MNEDHRKPEEPLKGLEEGDWLPKPPSERGFNPKLMERIEARLDRQERRRRRWLRPFPVLALCCGIILMSWTIATIWQTASWPIVKAKDKEAVAESVKTNAPYGANASAMAKQAAPASAPIRTALLIGLRTDHNQENPDESYSTYRTLLLAPEEGAMTVAAQGSGILMPYGTKFWKLEAHSYKTATDSYSYITAHRADTAAATSVTFPDDKKVQVHASEKLLYVGNQYVSVSETQRIGSKGASVSLQKVLKLPQLLLEPNRLSSKLQMKSGAAEDHVRLQDVFGDGAGSILESRSFIPPAGSVLKELSYDFWSIVRRPGHWIAQTAILPVHSDETSSSLSASSSRDSSVAAPSDLTMVEYPTELPTLVTTHDELAVSWDAIRMLQPDAKDALSSPLSDMLAVLTDNRIVVFHPNQAEAVRQASAGQAEGAAVSASRDPLLTVDLQPGEQLVMAQWATGSYVQEWIDKTRRFLQP